MYKGKIICINLAFSLFQIVFHELAVTVGILLNLICRTIQHIVQALQVLLRGLVLVEQIHEEATVTHWPSWGFELAAYENVEYFDEYNDETKALVATIQLV